MDCRYRDNKKRGRPKPPPWLLFQLRGRSLEHEFNSKLDHARGVVLELRGTGGDRVEVGLAQAAGRRRVAAGTRAGKVEVQVQILSAGLAALRQRMVQEVERRHAEFHLVMFLEVEVLVDGKVAVEESRPMDVRPDQIAILSARGRRETSRVEELTGLQVLARIAGYQRFRDGNRVRSQE